MLLTAYKKIGIDAVAPGELDFLLGKDALIARSTETTFLSANITDKSGGKPLFTPFVTKDIAGVKVGIFGLIDSGLNLGRGQTEAATEDAASAARNVVASLKAEKADLIIALTHLGLPLDQKLAQDVEGIDIIIGGHSGIKLDKPNRMGKTIICQAFQRGQYLGRLDLTLAGRPPYTLQDATEGKKIARGVSSYVNSLVPMDANIKSEPDIDRIVGGYKEEVAKLQKEQAFQAPTAPTLVYRGEETCRKCHARIAQFQNATRHAHAFDILMKKNKQLDAQCIGCHSTGFRREGGFTLPFMVGSFRNVQCEACHGPAKDHPENPLAGKPFTPVRQDTCTGCHTPQWDPAFNFQRKLPLVSCAGALAKTAH